MEYAYTLPRPGEINVQGKAREYLDFITRRQLSDAALWRKFVSAYETEADTEDLGWRGEYWGKMMRGACLVYRCTADERLYGILRGTVEDLLNAAGADGRLSTYAGGAEFRGWDVWCRKYVLTGMLHFWDICKETALKERILDAMLRHAGCIIKAVGPNEGQIPITKTSEWWLGVNSCSILEPMAELYKRTGEESVRAFARYVLETGGCRGGSLTELALADEKAPFEYPETKAYETMSFFEGALAWYELTAEEKYLTAVKRFAVKVYKTDITLIGCAGCTDELFDNAALRQTEYTGKIMQETCVTVTWMRLCARLFLLTGEEKWADRVEQSAVNALYGSVNLYDQQITDLHSGRTLPALPFDSYSPLCRSTRGKGVGGLKFFADGAYYGCCACIGAAGLAVYPLIEAVRKKPERQYTLRLHRLNGKLAFTYGPYTLARDAAKEAADILLPVSPILINGEPQYTPAPCEENECVRLLLETANGKVLLTDYASCGKRWAQTDAPVTVWMEEA